MNQTLINSFQGEHRFLSNFWLCNIRLDGVVYPSVENAYQAAKFDASLRRPFQYGTPGEAKRMARTMGAQVSPDFKDRKVNTMLSLLRQKFAHDSGLPQMLVDTGDALLIEGNTWGDTFWGVCNGEGANTLGRLLMHVRSEINLCSVEDLV